MILLFNAATHMMLHRSRGGYSGGGDVSGMELFYIILFSVLLCIWLFELFIVIIDLSLNEYKSKKDFLLDLIPFRKTTLFFYKKISELD